jgi:flagellar hook-length control protein FliK
VHQQLDALASQQYVVHAQAWPGQAIEWDIDDPQGNGAEDEQSDDWNTSLRLTMPNLGSVEAQLHLTAAGIALRLVADDGHTVAALEAARSELEEALEGAGVPLTGFVAERRDVPE